MDGVSYKSCWAVLVIIEVDVKAGTEHGEVEHSIVTFQPLIPTGELAVGYNDIHLEWVGSSPPLERLSGRARCGRRRWAGCSA